MPVLLYFSMLVNSRLCYLRLLKSCLIRHVGNLYWQKSVVSLRNMEYTKPTFCDVSCLKDWPSRQTRNWGISSQYFFFRALQIGNFDDNCARHVCVWRRDTLKTNNPTLRKLFLQYTQTDPTDKLTLQQKEIWPRSMSNHRQNEYREQPECTWVSTEKGGRHVERIYLGMHMQNTKACGKPCFRFRKITNSMREIISHWFQDMSALNRTYKYERLVVAWYVGVLAAPYVKEFKTSL